MRDDAVLLIFPYNKSCYFIGNVVKGHKLAKLLILFFF